MRRQRRLLAFCPMFLLLVSLSASADPVTVNISDVLNPGESPPYVSFVFNGATHTLDYIGVLNTTLSTDPTTTFDTYCIDLYHDFGVPATWQATAQTTWNVGGNSDVYNPGQANIGGALGYLYDRYDLEVAAATGETQNIDAAALQVAIWSVEYNGAVATDATGNAFVFGSGNPTPGSTGYTQSQVYAKANADIASIMGNTADATFYAVVGSSATSNAQDLIGPGSGPNPFDTVVPEPSSFLLVTAGLGIVSLAARRARRKV